MSATLPMSPLEIAPVRLMQETYRLQKQWYPHAAFFGILFALKLCALVMAEAHHAPISPAKAALVVTQQMLNHDPIEGDFQLALRQQFVDSAESPQVAPLAIQGYVDFTVLSWATISAAVQGVEAEQMYGILEEWRQFRHLQPGTQLGSKQFVLTHANWASRNFWPQSLQTIHTFLDSLLIHSQQQVDSIHSQPQVDSIHSQQQVDSPSYLTGIQTAHDTALLYLDLLDWWRIQGHMNWGEWG